MAGPRNMFDSLMLWFENWWSLILCNFLCYVQLFFYVFVYYLVSLCLWSGLSRQTHIDKKSIEYSQRKKRTSNYKKTYTYKNNKSRFYISFRKIDNIDGFCVETIVFRLIWFEMRQFCKRENCCFWSETNSGVGGGGQTHKTSTHHTTNSLLDRYSTVTAAKIDIKRSNFLENYFFMFWVWAKYAIHTKKLLYQKMYF